MNSIWVCCLFGLAVVSAGTIPLKKDVKVAKDPCRLDIPCVQLQRESNPADCTSYLQCVAPSEWATIACPLDQRYSNVTNQCDGILCDTWECALPPTEPLDPAPCITAGIECTEITDGNTIPDKYYCSWYYKCVGGIWGRMQCPAGTPYYSTNLATIGATIPCEEQASVCLDIDFNACLDVEAQPEDACEPSVPCTQWDRISEPSSCELYQVCVAPHQWVVSGEECGGIYGPFNNVTDQCNTAYTCNDPWTCPVTPTPAPIDPAPCVRDPTSCIEGRVIPDKYYCSIYHKCSQGTWVTLECPMEEHYVSVALISLGAAIPCTSNYDVCDTIPFERCGNRTLPGDMDPCHPTVPCTQSERITYPQNCQMYQQCIGPYEWAELSCPPGETFSNITGECHIDNVCQEWPCSNDTSTKKPSEPCLIGNQQCIEGETVPDMYYCTSYYKCVGGEWIFLACPVQEPYYSMDMANLGAAIPCTIAVSKCDEIPFGLCPSSIATAEDHVQIDHASNVAAHIELSEPCLPEEDYQCLEGRVVPDRYQCTGYYTCYRSAWMRKKCPDATPYYDGDLLLTGGYNRGIPCTDDVTKCVTESERSCATTKK